MIGSSWPVKDDPLFQHRDGSGKVWCTVCGHGGYLGGRWMDGHRRGHAPCALGCGVMMQLLRNGQPRRHTRGCPK